MSYLNQTRETPKETCQAAIEFLAAFITYIPDLAKERGEVSPLAVPKAARKEIPPNIESQGKDLPTYLQELWITYGCDRSLNEPQKYELVRVALQQAGYNPAVILEAAESRRTQVGLFLERWGKRVFSKSRIRRYEERGRLPLEERITFLAQKVREFDEATLAPRYPEEEKGQEQTEKVPEEIPEEEEEGPSISALALHERQMRRLPRLTPTALAEQNETLIRELLPRREEALTAARSFIAAYHCYFPTPPPSVEIGEQKEEREREFSGEKRYPSLEGYLHQALASLPPSLSATEKREVLEQWLRKAPYGPSTFFKLASQRRLNAQDLIERALKDQLTPSEKEIEGIRTKIGQLSREMWAFILAYLPYTAIRTLSFQTNYRLVLSELKKRRRQTRAVLDLTQEGFEEFIYAIDDFDPHKGSLARIALIRIAQRMNLALEREWSGIKATPAYTRTKREIYKATVRLTQELQRPPTSEELAAALGWTVEGLSQRRVDLLPILSYDAKDNEDDEESLISRIKDNSPDSEERVGEAELSKKLREKIRARLGSLSERERRILYLRAGLERKPKSEEKTGQLLGISRERVRQIEDRAAARLRESPELQQIAYALDLIEEREVGAERVRPPRVETPKVEVLERVVEKNLITSRQIIEEMQKIDQERGLGIERNYSQTLFNIKLELGVNSRGKYDPQEATSIIDFYRQNPPSSKSRPRKKPSSPKSL